MIKQIDLPVLHMKVGCKRVNLSVLITILKNPSL